MKNIKYIYLVLISFLVLSACDKETELTLESNVSNMENEEITLVDNKLKFSSKESLASFMEQEDENGIKSKIQELENQGFHSLRPFFDENDDAAIDNYLAKKQSRIAKKGYLYSLKNDEDEIDLDDEIIGDSNFATILNEDREIYVEDKLYVYTTLGVFFCDIEDEADLRQYLKERASDLTSKEKLITARGCNYYRANSASGNSALSLAPAEGRVVSINSKINLYSTCGGGGGSGGGGSSGGSSGGGSNSSSTSNIPMVKPMSFGSCSYSPSSAWQKIFGERVKCNDYHDSKHRVQTQFWNENYFIWASIGTKAKYQKKRFIGWSESSTAQYIELGINTVKYTYNHPRQYNPFSTHHIKYTYKGVTYNSNGTQIYAPPKGPKNWPLYKEGEVLIPLVIHIDDILGNSKWNIRFDGVTTDDINRGIKELLGQAKNVLPAVFRNDLRNNKVMVRIVRYAPTQTDVIVSNRIKRAKSNTSFKFDTNFLLSFNSSNGNNFFKHLTSQLEAKKYSKVEVDIYGAALRNGKWKGKRVVGKD